MNEIEVSLRAYAELRNEDAENYIACYGRGFHAGCSRYRPLVEELLAALNLDQDNEDCEDKINNAIARAESLLNEGTKS